MLLTTKNIIILQYKEIMIEMKNTILKEVIKFKNTKMTITLDFYIYNDNHKAIIHNKHIDKSQNNLINNVDKKI